MHRPEVSEETKPEQQLCHVFVGGIVQSCYYSIAQLNTVIAAQHLRPTLHVPLFVQGAEGRFSRKKNDKLYSSFVSKPQPNPKGCKTPQILAKTMSINKHSEAQLNLWEVWCVIALSTGKVLTTLYYLTLKVKCAISVPLMDQMELQSVCLKGLTGLAITSLA